MYLYVYTGVGKLEREMPSLPRSSSSPLQVKPHPDMRMVQFFSVTEGALLLLVVIQKL